MVFGNFYHKICFDYGLFIRFVNRDSWWVESFLHWLATVWHLQMLQYCQFQVFLFWCQQNPHWFGFHVPNRRWHWPYNFQNWLLKPLLDRERGFLIYLFIIWGQLAISVPKNSSKMLDKNGNQNRNLTVRKIVLKL